MNPPSAGLDLPGRRSRATPTRISRVPLRGHTAAMGVVVVAARTPHGASHQSLASFSGFATPEADGRKAVSLVLG